MSPTVESQIEKRIELAAAVARVWEAITDSRQFGEWLQVKMDGPFAAGKPVGGQITFPGYEHLRMDIVVQTIQILLLNRILLLLGYCYS